MRKFLSPVVVESFIRAAGDKIFTVTFEKKDGSVRVLNGRKGVKKYVKGTGNGIKKPGLVTVFDMGLREYRTVTLNRVLEAKTRGAKLVVAN